MKKLSALALAAFTSLQVPAPASAQEFKLEQFGSNKNLHDVFDLVAYCENNRPSTVFVIQLGPEGTKRALEDGIKNKNTPVEYSRGNFTSYGLIIDENNDIHDVTTTRHQQQALDALNKGTLKQLVDPVNIDKDNLYRYMRRVCDPAIM